MTDDLKRQAALAALEEIRDGLIVGLGSGSTASIFIRELGKAGLHVLGIPTSEESGRIAEEGGPELADQLEAEGYDKYVKAAAV